MDDKLKAEMTAHMTDWLRERVVLQENQTLEISISILPVSAVKIVTAEAETDERVAFRQFLSKIPQRSFGRLEGSFRRWEITTLTMLKDFNPLGSQQGQNLGKVSLRDLLETLKQNGMSECNLAFRLTDYFRPTLADKAKQSIVKELTAS